MSSTPGKCKTSATSLKRVTVTSELIRTDVLLRLGLTATENGGVLLDLNVDGEVFPFATPAIVHNAKGLANIISIGDDIEVGDVEGWIRDVQRAEKRFERTIWVPRGILRNIDVTAVFLQSEGCMGG